MKVRLLTALTIHQYFLAPSHAQRSPSDTIYSPLIAALDESVRVRFEPDDHAQSLQRPIVSDLLEIPPYFPTTEKNLPWYANLASCMTLTAVASWSWRLKVSNYAQSAESDNQA